MNDDHLGGERSDDSRRPVDELCGLIVARHHAYLHHVIPSISGQLDTLVEHEPAAVAVLASTRAVFAELAHDLLGHLAKEENVLFPALEAMAKAEREGGYRPALPFPTVLHPIRLMETEHARIEAAMDHLREVTEGFVPPEGSSDGWRQCLSAFASLDEDLRLHLRAENEVLFPRALELERRLP
jgi:regulator of cell morphogenesis and NO signaling